MNKSIIYNAEVKFLTKHCKHCLDNKEKDAMIKFLFKLHLLENAEELGLPCDVHTYLHDIFETLGLPTKDLGAITLDNGCYTGTACAACNCNCDCGDDCSCETCETCKCCSDGVCSVCQ